jgi:hypothetical protein
LQKQNVPVVGTTSGISKEMDVILHCNYEELRALRAGARSVLDSGPDSRCGLALSRIGRANVEALLPHLDGDMTFQTLAELQQATAAVDAVVECLRVEMDSLVIATHPAHEGAVAAYFDFAHSLNVLGRMREAEHEMEAMIEVVTGGPANERSAREFVFPD